MFDIQAQRDMNKGFGDGLSRAVELALTPLLFGLAGFGLDVLFGTGPVLAIAFAVFAVIGMVARFWYGYDHEMREHEAAAAWNRNAPRADVDVDVDLWGDGGEAAS